MSLPPEIWERISEDKRTRQALRATSSGMRETLRKPKVSLSVLLSAIYKIFMQYYSSDLSPEESNILHEMFNNDSDEAREYAETTMMPRRHIFIEDTREEQYTLRGNEKVYHFIVNSKTELVPIKEYSIYDFLDTLHETLGDPTGDVYRTVRKISVRFDDAETMTVTINK